jgi:NAD+ kinase
VTNYVTSLLTAKGFKTQVFPIYDEDNEAPGIYDALGSATLLVAFGGDGTMLRAARISSGSGVPIIGVNMGGKGFLAELEVSELDRLPAVAAGEFMREERLVLEMELTHDGERIYRDYAINDVVIGDVAKVIDLTLYGDDRKISRFTGDGVVVSTPTGSTGYSLSAGGPIVDPAARTIVVTPICAHSLDARPFVVVSHRRIVVEIGEKKRNPAYLSVDGRASVDVHPGDRLEVWESNNTVCFAQISDRSFYTRVYEKLGDQL